MFAIFNPPAGAKFGKKKLVKGAKKRAVKGKGVPRKYVIGKSALDRARAKYCKTGSVLEKFRPAAISGRKVANNSGRRSMKRMKFNVGDYVSMNPPTVSGEYAGALDGTKPRNITGVTPILGGYISNALLTSALGKLIPRTQSGLGSYALGLALSGILGAAAKHFVGAEFAKGFVVGARAEPVVRAISDVSSQGFSALSLKGWQDEGLDDSIGMSMRYQDQPGALQDNIRGQTTLGDFSTPGQVGRAQPTESSTSQYSLPSAGAQAPVPQQTMQAYDEQNAIAAAMDSGGM